MWRLGLGLTRLEYTNWGHRAPAGDCNDPLAAKVHALVAAAAGSQQHDDHA